MLDKVMIGITISVIALIILLTGLSLYLTYGKATTYSNYTVTDKAVKNNKDSSMYLVYTVDENDDVMVFSVEDRVWIGRFDASDDYAKIKVGETYDFETIGIRNHFFSTYPDIIEITENK